MSSSNLSEKKETLPSTTAEKTVFANEFPSHGRNHLHFVPRSEVLPEYGDTDSRETIVGYDADLMGARVTLSNNEEKKLLRRIDWHLIPLLSIM
jgi:hypothetical protein